jgi:RND superfamily putative drug exporter
MPSSRARGGGKRRRRRAARVSPDGTIALARLELDRQAAAVREETSRRLIELAESASGDGLRIELGDAPVANTEEGGSPEVVGLNRRCSILLLAFGFVVAAGLPIAIAPLGLTLSLLLIGGVAALIDVPSFALTVAGVIGIAVGIDYPLLIFTCFRAALASGSDVRAAAVEVITTAGRSVLLAGATVVVSSGGLFLLGSSFPYLSGIAVAVSLAS